MNIYEKEEVYFSMEKVFQIIHKVYTYQYAHLEHQI